MLQVNVQPEVARLNTALTRGSRRMPAEVTSALALLNDQED